MYTIESHFSQADTMADEMQDAVRVRASAEGEGQANDQYSQDDQSDQNDQKERVVPPKRRQHRKTGGGESSETPQGPGGRAAGGGATGRHGRRRSEGMLVEYRGRPDEGYAVPTRHRRKGSDGMVPKYHLQSGGEVAGTSPKQEEDIGASVAKLQNHLDEVVAAECVQERKDWNVAKR